MHLHELFQTKYHLQSHYTTKVWCVRHSLIGKLHRDRFQSDLVQPPRLHHRKNLWFDSGSHLFSKPVQLANYRSGAYLFLDRRLVASSRPLNFGRNVIVNAPGGMKCWTRSFAATGSHFQVSKRIKEAYLVQEDFHATILQALSRFQRGLYHLTTLQWFVLQWVLGLLQKEHIATGLWGGVHRTVILHGFLTRLRCLTHVPTW